MVLDTKYTWDPHAYFNDRAIWAWEFAWLPHRCELSKKLIWLKYAYRGEARLGDYMDPRDIRWRTNEEHILKLIKQS